MIVGIGTDLIEIARIEKACRKQAFLSRIYTEEECRLAGGSISRLAGNFAVKEAVSKALGTGFRAFMPIDIEVLRNELGKPYVNLYGGVRTECGNHSCDDHQYERVRTGVCGCRRAIGRKPYEISCNCKSDAGH